MHKHKQYKINLKLKQYKLEQSKEIHHREQTFI